MEVAELIAEAESLLDELEVFSFNDDIVDAVMSGKGDLEDEEEFKRVGDIAAERIDRCRRLVDLLTSIRDHQNQSTFWDTLGEKGHSPGLFQVFSFALLKHSAATRRVGALLYAVLLGMEPLSLLWNNTVFNQVLSIMVNATQALDAGTALDRDESRDVKLTGDLFVVLSHVLNPGFKKLAGLDVVIALVELAVKLCTIFQKQFEQYLRTEAPKAMKFLDSVTNVGIEYALPSVLLALILDFLPQTKLVSSQVAQIRDDFCSFCERQLRERQDLLTLIIKHVLMRSGERGAVRESSAIVVHRLLKSLEDPLVIVDFLLKLSRAARGGSRVLALDVLRRLIDDSDIEIPDSVKLTMVEKITFAVRDQTPAVRAAALIAISSLIPGATRVVAEKLGLVAREEDDGEGVEAFMKLLHKRIVDEKLNVRKAALRCLKAIIAANSETPDLEVLEMVAERTRDRSVVLRQEAMNILSESLQKFDSPQIIRMWLDNVLPLALDVDTKTQDLALSHVDKCLLGVIGSDEGVVRALEMDSGHFDLMGRVLKVFVQKAINLTRYLRQLEKRIGASPEPVLWKLLHLIVSLIPGQAKKDYIRLWDQRDELPCEYLAVVSKISVRNEQVVEDVVVFLRRIADGSLMDVPFEKIYWTVALFVSVYDSCEAEATEIVTTINTRLNNAAGNDQLTQSHMIGFICAIFLMGELFEHCSSLKDMDFTGIQLMIAEKLPNDVLIPENVRAIAAVSLAKLCLWRRDISSSFVAAFAAQLHVNGNASVKCNALVALCDLCIRYSATVDPYVMDMSACFADADPNVRRQALLIMTKLMAEDYLKVRELVFFRFVYALLDPNPSIAQFARSCLFDVINVKDPRLVADHFLNSMLYMNDFIEPSDLGEKPEDRKIFRLEKRSQRVRVYSIMISRMDNAVMVKLLQDICTTILQDFVDEVKDLESGETLLSDAIDVMLTIEDEMEAVNVVESTTDDPRAEKIVNESRMVVSCIHDKLIHQVLPTLNAIHHYLRARNSPLQSRLRKFFRKLCLKHPQLLEELAKKEPILASELENDIIRLETPVVPEEVVEETRTPFRSPLLSRIAKTPQPSFIAPSLSNSPISLLSQHSQPAGEEGESTEKRPPIPFILDDEM